MEYNDTNRYAKSAKKFLAGKERKKYCEIFVLNDDTMEELCFLQEMNEKEIQALRDLRDKYGKDNFIMHLDEVYTEPDQIHDLTCGCEILGMNIDTPCHQYTFSRCELVKGELVKHKCLVELSDEAYIRLLSYCLEDRSMNLNKLRYADKNIYSTIVHNIDSYLCDDGFFMGDYPYLITMDEVKEDADKILSGIPELPTSNSMGYLFV